MTKIKATIIILVSSLLIFCVLFFTKKPFATGSYNLESAKFIRNISYTHPGKKLIDHYTKQLGSRAKNKIGPWANTPPTEIKKIAFLIGTSLFAAVVALCASVVSLVLFIMHGFGKEPALPTKKSFIFILIC